MTLQEFIKQYDYQGSIVLLEGKRDVLPADRQFLITIGQLLASQTKYILFRSGNASGADEYFSQGVTSINAQRLQVITPYSGHRKKYNVLSLYTIFCDDAKRIAIALFHAEIIR